MSVQVRELLESRAISKKGGKLSATRSFHVWNDATPIVTPGAIATAFGTNGLPVYGEEFPESPNLLARDYEYARVAGHTDLWLIRWDYAESTIGGTLPPKEPGQPGYVEVSATISASMVPAWRALTDSELASLVADGGPYPFGSSPTQSDIQGEPIDVAGNPLQDVVRQVEITITETRSGIPNLLFLLPFVWRRNNNNFLNAARGQLLYCGASINRIDINTFTFAHKFVLDRSFHMRQLAVCDAFGNVIPMSYPNNPANAREVAAKVIFVQPFPTYANFFAMSPNFQGYA